MHLKSSRVFALLFALGISSAAAAQNTAVCPCQIPDGPPNPHPYLVGYLGVYKNADWTAVAKTLDFNKMTHLNLQPNRCHFSPARSSSPRVVREKCYCLCETTW